jgi:hypothetical protein
MHRRLRLVSLVAVATFSGASPLAAQDVGRPGTEARRADPWASAKSFPSGKHDLFEI